MDLGVALKRLRAEGVEHRALAWDAHQTWASRFPLKGSFKGLFEGDIGPYKGYLGLYLVCNP